MLFLYIHIHKNYRTYIKHYIHYIYTNIEGICTCLYYIYTNNCLSGIFIYVQCTYFCPFHFKPFSKCILKSKLNISLSFLFHSWISNIFQIIIYFRDTFFKIRILLKASQSHLRSEKKI